MKKLKFNIVLLFLAAALFISLYTVVLQVSYSKNTLEAALARDTECADAIHQLVSNKFTKEDYENLVSREDMQTPRYQQLQKELNELRTLNSTRYLYTAKRGADGKLIYLIDGLDLDAKDFAYPGTYIEKEMIPYISAALDGEKIYSQEIVDTTWGHIFTACYPVRDSQGSGEIIGALCIEMDMESSYQFLKKSNQNTIEIACVAISIAILLAAWIYASLRKQSQKDEQQQKALEEAAVAADAANQAKSRFLFNMSHDIRTPMNAILGYTELAGKNLHSPAQLQEYLKKIGICGQKMLSIIDNVLELSRIESGHITIEESAVEVGSIFDACLLMVQPEIEKKHQSLRRIKEITYPYLYFDTSRVTEIVLNLLSNAIKYTGDGGKITCKFRQLPHPKEGWVYQEFSVADNGIGMSEEFQTHIYETFARERSSTVSGIEGTGLGMGIVKKLIDLMDGTIEVESKLGEGSTFTICVPCRIASYEDTQPKQIDLQAQKRAWHGKRILLAEDNDMNAEISMALLSEVGLEVDRVADGAACIHKLEQETAHTYGLILMDIQMPTLDGYDTTERIRAMADPDKANIPIIAMTANAFAEDREKALSVGMNDHVAKPIDINKLLPTLEKFL